MPEPVSSQTEVITLNGNRHRALVDRAKRQITLKGDVPIAVSDTIAVSGMTGPIDVVERNEHYTVVTLGGYK